MGERQITSTKKPKVTFTLLSLFTAVTVIVIMTITIIVFTGGYESGLPNRQPGLMLNIIFPVLIVMGLIFTYLSFKQPEGLIFIRWFAACLNVFFMLMYGASLIFLLARIIG